MVQDSAGKAAVVALAGGVGGARMAEGLAGALHDNLSVIVNTADDFELWGLNISPDLDTVMYTLAGLADPVNGWGIAGDTHHTLTGLAGYGVDTWFSLGDRDFATHIIRTQRLRTGDTLASITTDLAKAIGVGPELLPMTNQPVATMIQTGDEELDFQSYFVARRQADVVDGVRFAGIEAAVPAPGVLDRIAQAPAIIFCPSNPIVSLGPILATPGIRDAISNASGVRIGVSPIIGGKALKGPADRMLSSLGHEPTALGVARIYADLLDVFVIDQRDAALADDIRALGLDIVVLQTIMGGTTDRIRLADEIQSATIGTIAS